MDCFDYVGADVDNTKMLMSFYLFILSRQTLCRTLIHKLTAHLTRMIDAFGTAHRTQKVVFFSKIQNFLSVKSVVTSYSSLNQCVTKCDKVVSKAF